MSKKSLLNAICAPISDGNFRGGTLNVHNPIVCNPSSLALLRTFL